jgi:hypothetical protein
MVRGPTTLRRMLAVPEMRPIVAVRAVLDGGFSMLSVVRRPDLSTAMSGVPRMLVHRYLPRICRRGS